MTWNSKQFRLSENHIDFQTAQKYLAILDEMARMLGTTPEKVLEKIDVLLEELKRQQERYRLVEKQLEEVKSGS